MSARPDFTERWMINGHADAPQQYYSELARDLDAPRK
jgi:hypothetical protein